MKTATYHGMTQDGMIFGEQFEVIGTVPSLTYARDDSHWTCDTFILRDHWDGAVIQSPCSMFHE